MGWQVLAVGAVGIAMLGAAPYRPGERMSVKRFLELGEMFQARLSAGDRVADALRVWNEEADRETGPAALRLYTDPAARAFYGDFNDPEERHTGKYKALKDDGAGLRVIRQLEIEVAPGDRRLVSSITFWEYDFARKEVVPTVGPDTFRMRVEAAPFKKDMVALSYQLDTDPLRRVHRVRHGVYIDQNGEPLYHNISVWGRTDHCNGCHKTRNKFDEAHITQPVAETQGYRDYLAYLKLKGATEADLAAAREKLARPLEMVPKNLVEILRARLTAGRRSR